MRILSSITLAMAVLAMAACMPAAKSEGAAESKKTEAAGETAKAAPLKVTPIGPAQTIKAEEVTETADTVGDVIGLQTEMNPAKIYWTVGGDPAINGMYVMIAAYQDPGSGWRNFKIGDFAEFSVLEDRSDTVVLKALKQSLNPDGTAKSDEKILIVTVPGADSESITVTPAKIG